MKHLIFALLLIASTGAIGQVKKFITPKEQFYLDSLCDVRGHVYEEAMDSTAFAGPQITDNKGLIYFQNFITNNVVQSTIDSFKVFIDAPDSSYMVWRFRQTAKFCFRCLRYIPQPALMDEYIKTIWKP